LIEGLNLIEGFDILEDTPEMCGIKPLKVDFLGLTKSKCEDRFITEGTFKCILFFDKLPRLNVFARGGVVSSSELMM
jgi:hypothetical protein